MSVPSYLNSKLKDIANTYPSIAPVGTKVPFIIYTVDSQEVNKTISGRITHIENFVTVTVFSDEYDKADALALKVEEALECSREQNIMGVTYNGQSKEFDGEPIGSYSVALEFSVYEGA